jgi:hypothetical protein
MLRYGAMYATSTFIGWIIATFMAGTGTPIVGARARINKTARQHAEAAARKEGPYLAPVTVLAVLLIAISLAAWVAMS